jgi:hypothetical protein
MSTILVGKKQRRSLRRAVQVPCSAISTGKYRELGSRVLDMSTRGMLVQCDDFVRLGESLMVMFRTPRGGVWLDAEAEVARIIHGWRTGDPGYCMGLRFTYMERPDRNELMCRLAGLPPPIPQRRRKVDYAETVRRIAA